MFLLLLLFLLIGLQPILPRKKLDPAPLLPRFVQKCQRRKGDCVGVRKDILTTDKRKKREERRKVLLLPIYLPSSFWRIFGEEKKIFAGNPGMWVMSMLSGMFFFLDLFLACLCLGGRFGSVGEKRGEKVVKGRITFHSPLSYFGSIPPSDPQGSCRREREHQSMGKGKILRNLLKAYPLIDKIRENYCFVTYIILGLCTRSPLSPSARSSIPTRGRG